MSHCQWITNDGNGPSLACWMGFNVIYLWIKNCIYQIKNWFLYSYSISRIKCPICSATTICLEWIADLSFVHSFQPIIQLLLGRNHLFVVVLGWFAFFQFNKIMSVSVTDTTHTLSGMPTYSMEYFAFRAERLRCSWKKNRKYISQVKAIHRLVFITFYTNRSINLFWIPRCAVVLPILVLREWCHERKMHPFCGKSSIVAELRRWSCREWKRPHTTCCMDCSEYFASGDKCTAKKRCKIRTNLYPNVPIGLKCIQTYSRSRFFVWLLWWKHNFIVCRPFLWSEIII